MLLTFTHRFQAITHFIVSKSRAWVTLGTLAVVSACGGSDSTPISEPRPASLRLHDTGITVDQCYAAGSDTLISCTSSAAKVLNELQDGRVGRDITNPENTDGKLGFSYSTVGSYRREECIRDNLTGLTWEGKAVSGLRAGVNTYTNYGDGSAKDVSFYVAAVNAVQLCGYSDWRLPTTDELQGIVDYGVAGYGPAIDSSWFPNSQPWTYWTATGYAGHAGYAWYVNFLNGHVYGYLRSNFSHVRLVR